MNQIRLICRFQFPPLEWNLYGLGKNGLPRLIQLHEYMPIENANKKIAVF